ncbi:putative golgin subfamily A member 6-like protein 3 [Pan paniscus]|uniref:putative golgin subfamily A member 6-like protein 3 n=1 Tax=Pan paniscus TaxID=9597 RepID=UPI003004D9A0
MPYSLHIDIDSGKSLHFPCELKMFTVSLGGNGRMEYFVKTVKEDVAVGADHSHECYCSSFPQLKAYWQRKSPGIPAGANRKKNINGSSPDTATSGGYHSPGDSQYQELAVALDSSSAIISQLTENINSPVRTSKEEKKHKTHRVQKLGRSLFKFKKQTGKMGLA